MEKLALQRCFNHGHREAVARCPQCRQFFCRECVTEHEDRILCAACLAKLASVPLLRRPAFVGFFHLCGCVLGVMAVWFFFYLMGDTLLKMPSSFHEGTLWQVNWFDR